MKKYPSKVNQVFIPYWDWEDFINGMWRKETKENENKMLITAIEFTGEHILYGNAMREVIIAWEKTMLNSLTNSSINRRAFLGHCACQFKLNIPEYITRLAWKELTNKQRDLADYEAQTTINKWLINYEKKNIRLHKKMGVPLLF